MTPASEMLLAVDIGNSALKWASFAVPHATTTPSATMLPTILDSGRERYAKQTVVEQVEQLRDRMQVATKRVPTPVAVAVATVVPEVAAQFLAEAKLFETPTTTTTSSKAKPLGPAFLLLVSDGALFQRGLLQHRLQTPETTGVDRLLAACAGIVRHPTAALLLVDAGTAITVDLVIPPAIFCGGAILPGLGLLASVLASGTAALPTIDWHQDQSIPDLPGTATRAAIRAGVFHAASGGINQILQTYMQLLTNNQIESAASLTYRVLCTGGDMPLLATQLSLPHEWVPHLVLEGIFAVWSRWEAKQLL